VKKIFKYRKSSKSFIFDLQENRKVYLRDLNVKSNDFEKKVPKYKKSVILFSENSLDFIISYFCLIQNNFVVFLVNIDISNEDINRLISNFKPNYICYPKRQNVIIKLIKQKKYSFGSYDLFLLNSSKLSLNEEICLLLPTSGSTGESKFVKLTYKNIVSNVKKIINYLKISNQDKTITTLPPEYSYGLSIINTHIFKGASIFINKKSIIEKSFWENIKKFNINSFGGVPFTYEILKKLKLDSKLKKIKSIKYLTQAGGKLSNELQSYINSISKKYKFKFYVMYGSTEASPRMSILLSGKSQKIGSIGKPLKGCFFYLKKKNKIVKKAFVKGDLYFVGDNIYGGYASRIDELKYIKKFKYLKTGDIAYFDKQNDFYIQGRSDRIIKLKGIRLELDNLEKEFGKRFLKEVKLVLYNETLKVFFIKKVNNMAEIKSKVSKLSNVHPSNIKIYVINKFPLTSSNKINYNNLKKFNER
tara:strand:+ start:840 stop:2261 length:1422 start_codon:yes stop_codon:yes gene_type:complete